MGQKEVQHVRGFVHKLPRNRMLHHEAAHILVQAAVATQALDIERVGQKAHVVDQVGLPGQPALEAEGHHLNAHGHVFPVGLHDGLQLFLQLLRAQGGGVDHIIGDFPKGLQAVPLHGDGLGQAYLAGSQGMIPAAFLVAGHQHVVAGLHEQGFNLMSQGARLADQAAEGLRVEKLAAAHVHGKGHQLAVHGGGLADFHELDHHHRRKVVHTEGAKILQIPGSRGLSGAAQAGQQQEAQMNPSLSYKALRHQGPARPRPQCEPPAPAICPSGRTRCAAPAPSAAGNPPPCPPG